MSCSTPHRKGFIHKKEYKIIFNLKAVTFAKRRSIKNMEEITRIIDIDKVIGDSKSQFIKSLPNFIAGFIKRVVHQDELNKVIHKYRDKSGVPFVECVLKEWNIEIEVKGDENIPAAGRFVFVANHPLGGIDAMSLLSAIYRHFQDLVSPSNQLFSYVPQMKPFILGVNVFGKNTKETAEKLNQLFESDTQIMIFPAGEVSRRVKGVISDPAWQKTFITKAIRYEREIIPIFISGRNSDFFYFVANLRKLLGIKLYIETILLPHEMLRKKNTAITITFGKPISWKDLNDSKSHAEWAHFVQNKVYSISLK
jgi:putative hemolysin